MTRAEAKRAALLSTAWGDLADFRQTVESNPKLWTGYTQRVLSIGVWQTDDNPGGGGSGEGSIHIDIASARRLLPLLEEFLRAELTALGIDVSNDDGPSTAQAPEDK